MEDIHNYKRLSSQQAELARRHAYAVFLLRPWVMDTFGNRFMETTRGYHPLNPNLYLNQKGDQGKPYLEDLEKFAVWATDKDKLDYLEPWEISSQHADDRVVES